MASEIAISISSNEKSFFAWDIRTGTVFSSFRNSSGLPNTVISIPFPAQGPLSSALLLVAQPDSALLNVHTWSKVFQKFWIVFLLKSINHCSNLFFLKNSQVLHVHLMVCTASEVVYLEEYTYGT